MQQPSQHLVKVGILLGVLGLCLVLALIGCNSEPEPPIIDPCDGPGWHDCFDLPEVPMKVVGIQYALGDTLDKFDGITQVVLSYDSTANAFTGTVENITEHRLSKVGVVVYLGSHESRLGSAPLVDLAPGQVIAVTLPVGDTLFNTWSAGVGFESISIAPDVRWGGIQNGVRFALDYDSTANAFTGVVENITSDTLSHITVEVRLGGSADRGAQVTVVDLAPSQVSEVTIPVGSDPFTTWSGHLTIR